MKNRKVIRKNQKQKIINVIVPNFYPVVGGMETNILETYSELVKRGWKVIVHTSTNTLTQLNVLQSKGSVRGIAINRYKAGKYGFFPDVDWKKANFVALHNFDLVSYTAILAYALFLKVIGKKRFSLILIPHGVLTPEWQWFTKTKGFVRKLFYPVLCIFLLNNVVDGIRAVSEWEKKKLIHLGIKDSLVKTIYNGIEEIAFEDVDKNASQEIKKRVKKLGEYLIQVGRISNEKNYETVIKALPHIPKHIKYVIVGPIQEKEYKQYLSKLTKKLNVENRVIFFGVVEGFDKYYLLKKAQMMIHMSRWESFCNVVHEGMSQGLVCIVSNVTALPYLVKNGINGFTLDPEDSKGVTDKINYILNHHNDAKLKAMRETNKKSTRQNTWDNVALKVESFYLEILNQK